MDDMTCVSCIHYARKDCGVWMDKELDDPTTVEACGMWEDD